jgi:hypothetical protein
MADVPVQDIPDDAWISQSGHKRADGSFKFTNRPRPLKKPPEEDVSFLLGELGAREALMAAFQRDDYRAGKDAVRKAHVGTLRSAGFVVEHTPRWGSEIHISVFWPHGEWDDTVATLIDDQCTEGVVDV